MYLTFDVGTTSVKTALYDAEGRLRHKVIKDYQLDSPAVGWYEVNPEIYWKSVVEGFQEILSQSGTAASDIKTIAGCSQGETVIFLDQQDHPTRPAMVWLDGRAQKEAEQFSAMVDVEEFFSVTGIPEIEPTWSACKMLWVKQNQPDVFRQTAKFMLVEDYIVYKLTGKFVSSASLLSTSALVDIHKNIYWRKTVDFLGVESCLPTIIAEGSFVGEIQPSVAVDIGLKSGILVFKGSMDQTMSAVGAGNIVPGVITETTGTALVIGVTARTVDFRGTVKLAYQPHVIPATYLILPFARTAGIVYKWFRDQFAREEIQQIGDLELAYEALNQLAATIPAGADGIVCLPFLAGGAPPPDNNSYAKGIIYGLTLKHGKAHIARAIMESIGYLLKSILTHVEQAGIAIQEVRSMGGGARSDLWLQIKADICNYPIVRMQEEETSTLGAAILSAVKVGDYATIEDAVQAMVKPGKRFLPNPEQTAIYARSYALYRDLCESLMPLFKKYA
ncbi:hypothetical protein U27_03054 [Candidatus Vecturithrix granuli]|uniref:Xylulokinase n=1 Tax=Vecturithrix granuli TaxID=1499967 RepID=A0A081BUT7_VECG1|nr:hypothetical protein U27_03054 [Candidatus Vecturithrix granuli]